MEKISKITGEIKIPPGIEKTIKNISDLREEIANSLKKSVSETLEVTMGGAIFLNSSDVHVEPSEKEAKIRIRVDGVLQDVIIFEKKFFNQLLSRIKLLSGLKLNVYDRPQDGRFSILLENLNVEIRTSTLPSEYGETIVMRILNPKSLISLSELGLREEVLKIFKKEIKKPNGMIIVTGPTGSGKTTTLYAILKEIRNPDIKIITLEDPIEYHLEGITQTQIDPKKGYDFANGLRAILRQDPDVILLGEIRDLETATVALQAALTGHLVLTTLHTNDAAGTIARLQALGEKPVNIAPAINMVVAQRLVRKVCKKCVKFDFCTEEELGKLKENLKMRKIDKNIKIPRRAGCKDCNFTGYRGRVGIYEVFLVDDEMEKFILSSPSTVALKEKAVEKGMVTMYQDGLIKVLEGITTFEEVERVCGE